MAEAKSEKEAQGQSAELESPSLVEEILQQTKMKPSDYGYDVAKKGVEAFIAEMLKPARAQEKIERRLIDEMIAEVDRRLSLQLDEVLHHPDLQRLESAWRGLRMLVDRTDFRENVKLEILNVSKQDLIDDFEDAPEIMKSGLYKTVYTAEYGQFGGKPFGALIGNYDFGPGPQDMALLQKLAAVSAMAHAPFIAAASPKFFGEESFLRLPNLKDIKAIMEGPQYIKWRSFRESEDSRYVGLTFPRFMIRLPYGPDSVPVKGFNYVENVKGPDHEKYLWSNASFAFASNMVRSFVSDGWCVQIRGPQAGGTVENLPVHLYDVGKGKQMKIPTEVPIDETTEFTTANLGFIPFSHYQGRDYACFFSAQSTQKPAEYDQKEATANSRINARLPYIFLASRIAHYLKVIQRENIGTVKDRTKIEKELNTWIKGLIIGIKDPSEQQIAKYPLRDAQVKVYDIEENPGFYRVEMMIMPHFQIEGMDISLSLVGKMPKGK